MRQIVAGLFMSLDGVVEAPQRWTGPYWSEEMSNGIDNGVREADAILIGRDTYVEFTDFWQPKGDGTPLSAFLNNTHKYVVSSSLTDLAWREASLISGDVAGQIRELKSRTGGNIQVPGSPRLVRWLLEQGLLDRLMLNIAPVVVGQGRRLFDDVSTKLPLELARSYALPHGVLGVEYRPAPAAD
jgi:dihydrofolate reductase